MEKHRITVTVPGAGFKFVGGIASSYEGPYPAALKGVVPISEFNDILDRLNDTIRSYWPCNACMLCGYSFAPCTLGLSLLFPNYCASMAEQKANTMLRNTSLRARNFDRDVVFEIRKEWFNSYLAISFPAALLLSETDAEMNEVLGGCGSPIEDADEGKVGASAAGNELGMELGRRDVTLQPLLPPAGVQDDNTGRQKLS